MRVLVIGDSLVMPRLEYNYDETWLSHLVNHYPSIEFIDKSRRSSSARRLVNDGAGAGDSRRGADLLEYYNPDLVITQIGITDCSPRLLKRDKLYTKVINSLPRNISNLIYNYIRKTKGRTMKNNDLSPEEFRNCWENYIKRANIIGTKILCLLIAPAVDRFLMANPLVEESIKIYNRVLEDLVQKYPNFVCVTPFTKLEMEEFALIDGYHIGTRGHKALYKKLVSYLDEFVEEGQK